MDHVISVSDAIDSTAYIFIHTAYIYTAIKILEFYDFNLQTLSLMMHYVLPVFYANLIVPFTPVFRAIASGQYSPFLRVYFHIFSSSNLTNPFKTTTRETYLHFAIKNNANEMAALLASKAIESNQFVETLSLKNQSYLDLPNIYGETALHYASAVGNFELVAILAGRVDNINNYAQYTRSYLSLQAYFAAVGYLILQSFKTLINPLSLKSKKLLSIFSVIACFKELFTDDVFEDFPSKSFGTPLHYAVHHGDNMQIFKLYTLNLKYKNLSNLSHYEFIRMVNIFLAQVPAYIVFKNISVYTDFFIDSMLQISNYTLNQQLKPKSYLFVNSKYNIDAVKEFELQTVKILLESGADPDLTLSLSLCPENFYSGIIIYSIMFSYDTLPKLFSPTVHMYPSVFLIWFSLHMQIYYFSFIFCFFLL